MTPAGDPTGADSTGTDSSAGDSTRGDSTGGVSTAGSPVPGTADRAAAAETAVLQRHLRRLWALPGTRLGVVSFPASPGSRIFLRWHYWWQAHLLDALVDAQLRRPEPERLDQICALIRGHRVRNLGRWGNNYYDDIAWWGLALHRAHEVCGPELGLEVGQPVAAIARDLVDAWSDAAGGGIPWRRRDNYRNTPANGPAAILLARSGFHDRAFTAVDWMDRHLLLPGSDLIADGLRPGIDGEREIDPTVWSYNQGVVLGAELEVVISAGRDPYRIHRLVSAIGRSLSRDDALIGHGGGNEGLFTGILARYLAQVATRLPGDQPAARSTRELAASLVLRTAESAWLNRIEVDGLPLFGPEPAVGARAPSAGGEGRARGNALVESSREPERDLSVQLAGWMIQEAADLIRRECAVIPG